MPIRLVLSLVALVGYGLQAILLDPAATLVSASVAGNQFANSDGAAVTTAWSLRSLSHVGALPLGLLLVALLAVWWAPLCRVLKGRAPFGLLLLAGLGAPQGAWAFADKADRTEVYTILPNQSAFFIPDAGGNKDSQARFESEAFLAANRVPLKRFQIPHAKLSGSGGTAWFSMPDFYVSTGRLIIVDRTTYSREWVNASDRGSSVRKEGFFCQSKEGLNISGGINIGVSITEDNAAKYLYHFGVIPPQGDPTSLDVIFTSVFYSRKVADVMDDVGRKLVNSLICSEMTTRTLDDNNAQANAILEAVRKSAASEFSKFGIDLDFLGWADTFSFDQPIQDAINRRYVAQQDKAIAELLAPLAPTIGALASAEAVRAFGQKTDGKLPTSVVGYPAGFGELLGNLLHQQQPVPIH